MHRARPVIALACAAALVGPAAAAGKGDSGQSAAEHEAQMIKEGKAKNGRLLAPAPEPGPGGNPAPPPGPPGPPAPPVAPPAPPLTTGGLIAIVILAIAGVALFADLRRQSA
jgi:hypothetical protein